MRDLRKHDRLLQRLQHISLQILRILNPATDSHQIIKDPDCLPLTLGDTRMCHATRDLDQALYTTQTLRQCKYVGGLAESFSSCMAAFDAEREHTSAHTISVLFASDGSVRVGIETGIVDSNNAVSYTHLTLPTILL